MNIGNLLIDDTADSFISREDASVYLEAEGRTAWAMADPGAKDAALTAASRWLAVSFDWLPGVDLTRIRMAAARLAVEALTTDLWAGDTVGGLKKRVKAGSVEVEYADDTRRAQAGGKRWPWLLPMLSGLIRSSGALRPVVRA